MNVPTILGIDPGAVSATLAVLDTNANRAFVDDVPVLDKQVNAAEFSRLIRRIKPTIAIIELVGSMPGQGVSSTFKFGMGCGLLRGVLATLEVPLVQVTPAKWKRALGLDRGGSQADKKELARAFAIRTFPSVEGLGRKRDAGRAEALLLAYYWQTYGHDIV
jgi:Holliday junction resolvasome RuvABC endonuclease subunit